MMDPLGKKELLGFYSKHLRAFGDSPQAVRWTRDGQIRRYETFLEIAGDLSGKAVLDFGCGKGDLCGFLKKKGIIFKYCGIDVNESLIELAKTKYPGAEFIVIDIEEDQLDRCFDIIVACGVFNLRIAGIDESARNVIKKLFSLCRESLHVNFLSYYVPRRDVELFYVKPEEMLHFVITEVSRTVTLRQAGDDVFLSLYKA